MLFLFSFSGLYSKVIHHSSKPEVGSWYCFKKEINIDGDPSKASIRLAAELKYWLWIKGELVVYEGG